MTARFEKTGMLFIVATALLFTLLTGCSKEETAEVKTAEAADSAVDTPAQVVQAAPPVKTVIDVPVATPQVLRRRINEIISWTSGQADVLNSIMSDVARVVMFEDLGLGDQLEMVAPRFGGEEPPVQSLQLVIGREKTAVVARFVVDTLPGPRVRGESAMGMMGIHGDTLFGRDVVLPRTQSSSGRFEMVYVHETLFLQTCCCGLPGSYGIGRYGTFGDTLTAIYIFIPSIGMYSLTLAGQEACRTFPGYHYTVFRTERGEFHREVEGYPYLLRTGDSSRTNLYFGRAWRGRKTNLEPIIRIRMF
jgi:hypothetical protein